ncbi:putative amino acid dehydrogenase [Orenia metallireducens]|uniref:Predicted amino acid dehydrogenase n=1 Tax=Orenia metallireducens TaxID=1413210 RepID=A0A285G034_9FIRM|nr:polysaccharide biosynthesis protein [Orenia metallireducens]PRX31682.1 putative amino acid dehydrogenase [Orenia metallireducens]SNY16899.1 Predicted amino acid dehydrogenase [Orenia metallireducens]
MKKFGFIIHPLDVSDIARKFPVSRFFSDRLLEKMLKVVPAFKASHITGIESVKGVKAEGYFVCCPLTARQMIELPTEEVIEKIIDAGRKAEELGAEIVGLGAFTSVVGDKGLTVAQNLNIPVTTGNSYTVATALEGIRLASDIMGINMGKSNILIVGATGSIGKACSKILARDNKYLMLVARREERLKELADELRTGYNVQVETGIDLNKLLPEADIVVTVSSSVDSLIDVSLLKSGAIVCDIARPRDVAEEIALKRDDILVIDGGIVEVPGEVEFNLNFGFPKGTSYACMAETMILSLEGRYENYSLGAELDLEKIIEISNLADKHGFRLSSLRSLEREVTLQQVSKVRRIVSST